MKYLALKLERELNAAKERIKQLERDLYTASEKIKRLEGWNTQNCNDKTNLMETLRDREARIKRMEEAGDELHGIIGLDGSGIWVDDNELDAAQAAWNAAKKPLNDSSPTS